MRRRFRTRRRPGRRKAAFFLVLLLAVLGLAAWLYLRDHRSVHETEPAPGRSTGSGLRHSIELPPPQALHESQPPDVPPPPAPTTAAEKHDDAPAAPVL